MVLMPASVPVLKRKGGRRCQACASVRDRLDECATIFFAGAEATTAVITLCAGIDGDWAVVHASFAATRRGKRRVQAGSPRGGRRRSRVVADGPPADSRPRTGHVTRSRRRSRCADARADRHKGSRRGWAFRFGGWLNGEGEPKTALEMDSADDWSERAREAVRTELRRARVPTELVMNGPIPSPFPHELPQAYAPGAG